MVLHYLNRGLAFALRLRLGILGLFEEPPKPEPEPEPKPEPEPEPEPSPGEKSLAEKEAEIIALEAGETKTEEEEKTDEEEPPIEEDIDLDELAKEHPIIGKQGLKTDSVKELLKDVLTRYDGGVRDLQEGLRIKSALEKAGITDPDKQKEFFAALESGAFARPALGGEEVPPEPQTFADVRKSKFDKFFDSHPGIG